MAIMVRLEISFKVSNTCLHTCIKAYGGALLCTESGSSIPIQDEKRATIGQLYFTVIHNLDSTQDAKVLESTQHEAQSALNAVAQLPSDSPSDQIMPVIETAVSLQQIAQSASGAAKSLSESAGGDDSPVSQVLRRIGNFVNMVDSLAEVSIRKIRHCG